MLGVISYLPKDPTLRATRLKLIVKALEANQELFQLEENKYVVVQGYTKEEKQLWQGFKFIECEPKGAAYARNLLIDELEKSEDPFLWVMDDDITYYDYYGFKKTVKEFQTNDALKKVDVVTFFDPRFAGFRGLLDGQDLANKLYLIPQQTMNTGTASFLIRNSRQAGKPVVKFIENYRELKIREDISFLIDNIKAKKVLNTCPQIIYKWDSGDKGTIAQNKSSQKWIFELEAHALEIGTARRYSLPVNPVTGNLSFRKFSKFLRRTSKAFAVNRMLPLEDKEYTVFARERTYSKSTKKIIEASKGKRGLLK